MLKYCGALCHRFPIQPADVDDHHLDGRLLRYRVLQDFKKRIDVGIHFVPGEAKEVTATGLQVLHARLAKLRPVNRCSSTTVDAGADANGTKTSVKIDKEDGKKTYWEDG